MKKFGDNIIYSPSDLICFIKSPFASWMDRRYLEDPAGVVPDADDALMAVLARRGIEHEARFLKRIRDEGRDLVELSRGDGTDTTQRELDRRRGVLFQAHLAHGGFEGFADFLVRDDLNGCYAIWDTKLSRHVKPYHLIQLCDPASV